MKKWKSPERRRRNRISFRNSYDVMAAYRRRRALLVRTADGVDVPWRGPLDAGYELKCMNDVILSNDKVTPIRTGVDIALPEGYFGVVIPTRRVVRKHGVVILHGFYDESHRDEVVPLAWSIAPFQTLMAGSIFATLVVAPHSAGGIREVSSFPLPCPAFGAP